MSSDSEMVRNVLQRLEEMKLPQDRWDKTVLSILAQVESVCHGCNKIDFANANATKFKWCQGCGMCSCGDARCIETWETGSRMENMNELYCPACFNKPGV